MRLKNGAFIGLVLCLLSMVALPAEAAYSFTGSNPLTGQNYGSSFSSGGILFHFTGFSANSIPFVIMFLPTGVTLTSVSCGGLTWSIVEGASDGTLTGWAAYANNPTVQSGSVYFEPSFSGGPASIIIAQSGELLGGPTSSPLAASNGSTGTGTSLSTTLASLSSGSAIVAAAYNSGNNSMTAGSGYTGTFTTGFDSNIYGTGGEYNLSSASGSVAATVTQGASATWNIMTMALKPVGGAAAPIQGGFAISPSN